MKRFSTRATGRLVKEPNEGVVAVEEEGGSFCQHQTGPAAFKWGQAEGQVQ